MKIKSLKVLVFQSPETRLWGAQALEYDIFAEGETIKEALDNFQVSMVAELEYCKKYKVPFSSIGKAPKFFRDIPEKRVEEMPKLDSASTEKISAVIPGHAPVHAFMAAWRRGLSFCFFTNIGRICRSR